MPFIPLALGFLGGAVALILGAWGHRHCAVIASASGLGLGAVGGAWLALSAHTPLVPGAVVVMTPAAASCLVLGAIALTACSATLAATPAGPRIAILGAFAASSAALVAAAVDVGVLFVAVETLALCGLGLVAIADTDHAREAAMKWFIQGSVATVFFIIGIGVLLSRTDGSLSYAAIALRASAPSAAGPLAVGVVLVLVALAFKAGAFPFHSWMPDAFEMAPPAAVAVLASAGKVAPVAAALGLAVSIAGTASARVLPIVAFVSVASIVFGNLVALRQRTLARMLAYSAIAQVGYALAAIPLAGGSGGAAVPIFVMLYGVTSVASFVFIVALRECDDEWDGSIAGLTGLSRRRPALAASLVVIMLSLTGIPLTAGFWGKFLVFGAAATGGYLWLAIAGVLGSVVSFGYYGNVLRRAYLDADADDRSGRPTRISDGDTESSGGGVAAAATVVLALALLVAGIAPLITGLGALLPLR